LKIQSDSDQSSANAFNLEFLLTLISLIVNLLSPIYYGAFLNAFAS